MVEDFYDYENGKLKKFKSDQSKRELKENFTRSLVLKISYSFEIV